MSKPPPLLPPSFLSLSLSLSPSLSLPSLQPPRTAAASFFSEQQPPPSLPPPLSLLSPSPFLLLAPLWECSEGKRIVEASFFSPPKSSAHTNTGSIITVTGCRQTALETHDCHSGKSERGGRRTGLDPDQLDLDRYPGHHHHPISLADHIRSLLPCLGFGGFHRLSLYWITNSWSDQKKKGGRAWRTEGCEKQT